MTDNNSAPLKDKKKEKQNDFMGYYIPYRLFLGLLVIASLIFVLFDKLYTSFQATPALNSVIIFTILTVLYLNIENSIRFQLAAKKINKITNAIKNNKTEEYQSLSDSVEKTILNNFAFKQNLTKSFDKSRLIFDDKSAIIIKSKVGKRAMIMRSNVSHLTGILVMLGLIGTFWGMMGTLSSVGEVLSSLSNSLDSENGLSDLIGGISKPIAGMSVAFSSSLFGLAGSLVGSVLNNFVSKGIDRFIEDFGYWIDMHIPIEKKATSKILSPKANKDDTGKEGNNASSPSQNSSSASQNAPIIDQNIDNNLTNVAREMKRNTDLHENLIKQIMEFTSTQLYTSNTLKQSLLTLNSTQTKTIQILHSQKITSENLFLELQKLKKVIIEITNQFDDIHISDDLKYTSDKGYLQDRLDLLKQEFEEPDLSATDLKDLEEEQRKTG